jgi:hypothetical protein
VRAAAVECVFYNSAVVPCPVFDLDDRNDVRAPVHLVADEDLASQRVSANCGAMPGKLGWAVWPGTVPEHRQCEMCLSRPVPNLADNLTGAQLSGAACIRCGDEREPHRPVEAWSRYSSQLFECVDAVACALRRGE